MLRGVSLSLLLQILCLLVLQSYVVAAPKKPGAECWQLVQNNHQFGPVTTYVCNDGVRCDLQRLHVSLVCSAPTWDVCFFSEPRHLAWQCTMARFRDEGFGNLMLTRGRKSVPYAAKKTSIKVFGAPCEAIWWEASKNKGVLPSFYGMYYGKKELRAAHEYTHVEYLAQKYPPPVVDCLSILADVGAAGVPMTAYSDENGKYSYFLKTTSMSKQCIDKAMFAYPVGYKKTESADPLITTANSKQDIEESFGNLFGEKTKK